MYTHRLIEKNRLFEVFIFKSGTCHVYVLPRMCVLFLLRAIRADIVLSGDYYTHARHPRTQAIISVCVAVLARVTVRLSEATLEARYV